MNEMRGGEFADIWGRGLGRLTSLIESFPDDGRLWSVTGNAKNPPGTLALHLAGNVEHYIGAILGGTGYVRDREAEFGDREVAKGEILRRVESAKAVAIRTLGTLDDDALGKVYPAPTGADLGIVEGATTRHFLIHLTWHLGWHLGQIHYSSTPNA
jgi:uncharacterized damage-inducible protein DinB